MSYFAGIDDSLYCRLAAGFLADHGHEATATSTSKATPCNNVGHTSATPTNDSPCMCSLILSTKSATDLGTEPERGRRSGGQDAWWASCVRLTWGHDQLLALVDIQASSQPRHITFTNHITVHGRKGKKDPGPLAPVTISCNLPHIATQQHCM